MNELIEQVLVGGNHLANVLIANGIFPGEIQNVTQIDSTEMRDIWIAWRSIMDLSIQALGGNAGKGLK